MRLTDNHFMAIIALPLTHLADGICTPIQGQKAAFHAVFYCPSKIQTVLSRFKSFMVGCIEQPLIGLAVSLYGSANLIQSTAQEFALKVGGLFLRQGHKPMNNFTQKLTLSVSKKSLSRFNIFTATGINIARRVPFHIAIGFKRLQPSIRIKFAGMEGLL